MAKFDAGKAVEKLEYDFTAYDGGKGPIKEPTTGRVNSFFANSKALIHEVRQIKGMAEQLEGVDIESLSDEDSAKVLGQIDEASAGAEIFQRRTVENLALLCGAEWVEGAEPDDEPELVGGAPSFDDLGLLPYRVLQAFSEWLIQQIQPKKKTPASRR
jgi:hypothetical protein